MGALLLEFVACSNVPIKDEIFYANAGMQGATLLHTMTATQQNISFEDWMKIIRTEPLICSSVQTFGDIKAEIEQLCSSCNCCDYSTQQAVDAVFARIQAAKKPVQPQPLKK